MSARVVRYSPTVGMATLDHHNGLYYVNLFTMLAPIIVPPVPPAPIPPGVMPVPQSLHFVRCTSKWFSEDSKVNPTVVADGEPIVSRNHAAKHTIHVPPGGNILLPVTMMFTVATWKLGVQSVWATKGPVASTMLGAWGLTVNCGDPTSLPNGIFDSPGTVQVSPTLDDWAAAVEDLGNHRADRARGLRWPGQPDATNEGPGSSRSCRQSSWPVHGVSRCP